MIGVEESECHFLMCSGCDGGGLGFFVLLLPCLIMTTLPFLLVDARGRVFLKHAIEARLNSK